MLAVLVNVWGFLVAAAKSLVGGNTESRNDFVAINDALQAELKRVSAAAATAVDRCDRMQIQINAMFDQVIALKQENSDLKRQLVERNQRHESDENKIRMLTERVAVLEQGRMGS